MVREGALHSIRQWGAVSWVVALALLGAFWMSLPGEACGSAAEEVEQDFMRVVEEVLPAVVSIDYGIRKKVIARGEENEPNARGGSGSGFIFLPEGYIMTNAHVLYEDDPVKQALKKLGPDKVEESILVTLFDGRTLPARFIFSDINRDLAFIKIDGEKFATVKLGDSDQLKPGQWAIAIGNPLSLKETVSVGVISATDRQRRIKPNGPLWDFIQTSAPIFPGNSGGPLIDIHGRVIGINSRVALETENVMDPSGKPMVDASGRPFSVLVRTQAMGFAIPIRRALEFVRPYLKPAS